MHRIITNIERVIEMAKNKSAGKPKQEDRHTGKFVGAYLSDDQVAKIEVVEKKFDEMIGEPGRNRTRALRWILDNFDTEWLSDFPKSQASEGMTVLSN